MEEVLQKDQKAGLRSHTLAVDQPPPFCALRETQAFSAAALAGCSQRTHLPRSLTFAWTTECQQNTTNKFVLA